jgi:serine/threonine protein kinase/WD40 repeat protein
MIQHTQVSPHPVPPDADDIGLLAQLAFASRPRAVMQTHAPRHLAFLPPDALDMDLSQPAQRDFGDYELCEKIGQGGMGVVYRARQHSLDREVALKLLSAGPWASGDFIERFRREAQSAARLEHPNIVTVFDAGSQHDLHYFSMRLVRGESLAAKLERDGRLAPREAARLLRLIADALDYAHRLVVLHLDLKPGNVLIDEGGEPMVADFGLARRIDQAFADEGEDVSGTPSYMAPEQATARSQQIGRATDIYGLGAILYEALTGRPPFLAATPQATLERVVGEAVVAPREHARDIPPDLEAICPKCLAKAPDQRYPTAAALGDDLRRFLEDRPVSVRQPPTLERLRRSMRREPRVAAALGAFVLALVVGLVASTQQWRRAEDNASTSRGLLWEGRRTAALRLQQDGKAHQALPLLIDNLREAEAAGNLETIEREQRRVGLMLAQGATLVDRIAIDDANPFALELSPDGSLLAIAFNDLTVRWYDAATLQERGRISLAGRGSSSGTPRLPTLLRFADARHLRVTLQWYSNLTNPSDSDTWLVDLEAAAVVEPPAAFERFSDATFTPDGRHALLRSRDARLQYWQTSPWRPLAPSVPGESLFQPWLVDPQGRYALRFAVRLAHLEFHSLPALLRTDVLKLPHDAGVSAWALSRDGDTLALGDFEGRVFLVDVPTRRVRALPNARGREVVWLAFSEDDGWLASASYDGNVFAFDVASGDALHGGQMRHDFPLRRVGLSRSQRLLVASGDGVLALWRLSRPGPRAAPAQRIGAGPTPHGLAGHYASSWSLQTGLFASAGIDGQVRLWRLPTSPTLPARTARQRSDRLDFDGLRLVDVEWNRLRLIDPRGRPLGDWRAYAQPPGFAELVDRGRTLLVTVGPQLRFEDAVTGRALAPPQTLPDSPQRLLASPDGARVLLSFGGHSDAGFEERLRLYDVRSGAALGGEVSLPGPVRRYAYSPDGRRLLAVGPAESATTVLDAANLDVLADYPHDAFEPVQWADFAADGTVLLATRASDPRLGHDMVRRWDPVKDEICGETEVPLAEPIGVVALGERAFVAGVRKDVAVDAEGTTRRVERQALSEANTVMALDRQGRVLARAHRHEVQLFDARTLEPLGPALGADITALDTLVQLAFSPDGEQLVATSWLGYWIQWPVAGDPRSAAVLAAGLAPLMPEQEDQRMLLPPTTGERLSLRQHDPGPWSPPQARPSQPVARLTKYLEPVPARDAAVPGHLLDLTAQYDTGPDAVRNFFYNVRPSMHPLPVGVQSVGGIPFDLRGMVQIGVYDAMATIDHIQPNVVSCLPAASGTVAALHLLMDVSLREPVPVDTRLAGLTLRYEDDSSATLYLRAGRELPGYAGEDAGVPLAFAPNPLLAAAGLQDSPLAVVRMANPHPERRIRCLDVAPIEGQSPASMALLLLGLTLEPVPVIAATESRTPP